MEYHGLFGSFKNWTKAQRRAWCEWAVERTQGAYANYLTLDREDVPF